MSVICSGTSTLHTSALATQLQNTAVQCGIDPATQISSTPNFTLQITQLSWLPVVSKVAPPSLCRKAAIDLYATVESRTNWPVYADDFEHPPPWLASRRPMWSDMTSVDTITQWREDWLLSVLSTLHASSCVSRFVFCLQCFRLQCL